MRFTWVIKFKSCRQDDHEKWHFRRVFTGTAYPVRCYNIIIEGKRMFWEKKNTTQTQKYSTEPKQATDIAASYLWWNWLFCSNTLHGSGHLCPQNQILPEASFCLKGEQQKELLSAAEVIRIRKNLVRNYSQNHLWGIKGQTQMDAWAQACFLHPVNDRKAILAKKHSCTYLKDTFYFPSGSLTRFNKNG